MAIIWKKTQGGVDYEVRSAGNTRRLYTNGVFHSQYNPVNPVAGSVWDLLLLPAFFSPPATVRRVLVLGVGGGAVIRQMDYFLAPQKIVGVELCPVHLSVAKRFFAVTGENIELVQSDAVRWVKSYRGAKFDMIVEDLFADDQGEPIRAVAADESWFADLLSCLTPTGTLVMNFDSANCFKSSAFHHSAQVKKQFKSVFRFNTPRYENYIVAFCRASRERQDLFDNLEREPLLNRKRKSCRLNFSLRKIYSS